MQDIPMPAILDPERPRLQASIEAAADDAQKWSIVQSDLHDACAYGQTLWHRLAAVRGHLVDVLPDPHAADDATRLLTAPRGPDDDAGWERWRTAYEAVTSALAGPAGDQGFGRHEAAREATARRGALHAGERTADLVHEVAAQAAKVEHARSGGYVVGREPDPDPAPASGAGGPAPAPGAPPPKPVLAAAGVVAVAVAFVAGRRTGRGTAAH